MPLIIKKKKKRESYGTLLIILHLNFYVWSFYAFLHRASTHSLGMLDNSIYTYSLNGFFTFIIGCHLSQTFTPSYLGVYATTHLFILACI